MTFGSLLFTLAMQSRKGHGSHFLLSHLTELAGLVQYLLLRTRQMRHFQVVSKDVSVKILALIFYKL